jgi:undecaprenyl pyrophosphate phosphatase UppP
VTGAVGFVYAIMFESKALMRTLKALFSFWRFALLFGSAFYLVKPWIIPTLKPIMSLSREMFNLFSDKSIIPFTIVISTTLMLASEIFEGDKDRKLNRMDIILCGIANVIALIPGTSRLGTVYTLLRLRKLTPKNALKLSFIQGVIISMFGIIKAGGCPNLLAIENIICGVLNLAITAFVLNLSSNKAALLIGICGIYRYILAVAISRFALM